MFNQLKQIALSKQYKSLIGKPVRFTGRSTIQLKQNKFYTISSIYISNCNAYINLKDVKTPFDVPFDISQFELVEPIPVKQPKHINLNKYTKYTKLAILIIMTLSVFVLANSNAFAASRHGIGIKPNRYTYHLHVVHTSKTSHTLKNTYKVTKTKIVKPKTYKTKTTIFHVHKIKMPKTIIHHTKYAHIKTFKVATFHPIKFTYHSSHHKKY